MPQFSDFRVGLAEAHGICSLLHLMTQFSIREFVTGTVAGISGGLVGFPLDTVRVRLQLATAAPPRLLDSFFPVGASKGLRTVFRGSLAPSVSVLLQNSLLFGFQANLMRLFDSPKSLAALFLSGTISGAMNCLVSTPTDLLKIQLQSSPQFKNSWECLRRIVQVSGLRRGIFSGFWITVLRDAHSYGVYFASYDYLMRQMETWKMKDLDRFMAGGVAGCLCWTSSYPVDIVRARLLAQDMLVPPSQRRYPSALACFRETVAKEGYSSLWRGFQITMIRGFLVNGVTFVVYERSNQWWDHLFLRHQVRP